ncbi:MAG: hypothetical protein WC511_07455 [Candidatus Pacearchaeota archaeon]
MVSQHTANKKASLKTKQHKRDTEFFSKLKEKLPKEIVEEMRDPPLQSCRRDGSRAIVGRESPSQQPVYKDALLIERPSEHDVSHCSY